MVIISKIPFSKFNIVPILKKIKKKLKFIYSKKDFTNINIK